MDQKSRRELVDRRVSRWRSSTHVSPSSWNLIIFGASRFEDCIVSPRSARVTKGKEGYMLIHRLYIHKQTNAWPFHSARTISVRRGKHGNNDRSVRCHGIL